MLLHTIRQRLKKHQATVAFDASGTKKESAVLLPIIKKEQPELILTLRAMHLSSHAGEVSFPGGKREKGDTDLLHTALREAYEEIALPSEKVEIIGALQPLLCKQKLTVNPYVGFVESDFALEANLDEVDSIFTVPLAYFQNAPQLVTHRVDHSQVDWYVPCYKYKQFVIWGLTAMMITELANIIFDNRISFHKKPLGSSVIEIKNK